MSDFTTDSLDIYVEPFPAPATGGEPTTRPPASVSRVNVLLLIALVGLLLWNARGCIGEAIPKPNPIDADGVAVMFALDGVDGLSEGQAQVAASQKVKVWCDDNGVLYRRFDIADDLSKVEPMWQQMMNFAVTEGDPPSMVTVDAKQNCRLRDVPETTDEAIEMLGELIE